MYMEKYYPGFEKKFIEVEEGIKIHTVVGGEGEEAILFLHGHPENYLIWRFLVPQLKDRYKIVMTDLRGYGESSKPRGLEDHSNYSKRVMAKDQVEVMRQLGYEKFHVVSHDRGSRVAHRLVLDNEEKITSCTMMDILPTDDMYDETNSEFATKYWHWFFYIQPGDFPEVLLAKDPKKFIEFNLTRKIGPTARENFSEDILEEYTRHFANPQTIHGICEDYKASASIDRLHNDVDRNKKIDIPMLVLWGENGVVGNIWDVLSGWEVTCTNLEGAPIPNCGHFVPEEQPETVMNYLEGFLNKHSLTNILIKTKN